MNERQARIEREVMTVRMEETMDPLPKERITLGVSSIMGTRKSQQDSVSTLNAHDMTLAVVCDGMGGMEGGELASQLAIRILSQDFVANTQGDIPGFYQQAAEHMDEAVYGLVRETGEPMQAGTTVVSTIIQGRQLYWLSVGDSRIYILRDGEFIQVNRDHNYRMRLDEQLEQGFITDEEYLEKMGQGEALISYIGMGNVSLMDINPMPFLLEDGDVILLCSDGLYKRLLDEEIQEIIEQALPDVDEAATDLTRIVMEKTIGSQDNTSVILIQYNQYLHN